MNLLNREILLTLNDNLVIYQNTDEYGTQIQRGDYLISINENRTQIKWYRYNERVLESLSRSITIESNSKLINITSTGIILVLNNNNELISYTFNDSGLFDRICEERGVKYFVINDNFILTKSMQPDDFNSISRAFRLYNHMMIRQNIFDDEYVPVFDFGLFYLTNSDEIIWVSGYTVSSTLRGFIKYSIKSHNNSAYKITKISEYSIDKFTPELKDLKLLSKAIAYDEESNILVTSYLNRESKNFYYYILMNEKLVVISDQEGMCRIGLKDDNLLLYNIQTACLYKLDGIEPRYIRSFPIKLKSTSNTYLDVIEIVGAESNIDEILDVISYSYWE